MGRAEMIILVAAIAILGRYSLTVNDVLANNEIHVIQSEYELNVVGIAERYFRQAWLKSFDETTVDGAPVDIPNDFTDKEHLGVDSGESYPDFDDVDDFDDFSITGTADNGMVYDMQIVVGYISEDDKENIANQRSTLKRMNITFSSDYLRNDITLSRIFPYWK
ncbi:MAG: hypothetical protein K9M49_07620 [Candidatus Marinimicrobia bacterium]|nr:hypothetical protein [Candidatus Neomarinimicrobiota bacterium]MCF7850413.1 hypothetical protein [Candidatus Neomarinimicrobiota bacterium]MCF7905008.1 hypothetical protein [Candidatus Neomarinimicrobiota bacterium]